MKSLLTIVAVGVALVAMQARGASCGTACASGTGTAASVATLNPSGLATLVKAGVPLVILDARTGKYDDGRRVPGAKALSDAATAEDAAKLIPAKDSLVVTYCASPKCPASGRLAKHLQSLGYTNIVEMPEGIDGWVAEGKAVEKAN